MDEQSVLTLTNLRNAVLDLEKKYTDCGPLIREIESIVAHYEVARAIEEHKQVERKKLITQEFQESNNLLSKSDATVNGFLTLKPYHQLASMVRSSPLAKTLSRRFDLLEHLLMSERLYFQNLVTITENYCKPLADRTPRSGRILPPKQWVKIFQNIDDIKEVNKQLWKALETTVPNRVNKDPCVGKIFVENMESLIKQYSVYCIGLPEALKWLAKSRKTNNEFLQFLWNIEELEVIGSVEVQLPLGSLLFLPALRIAEYESILKELQFYTPIEHPDLTALDSAIESLRQFSESFSLKSPDGIKVQKTV